MHALGGLSAVFAIFGVSAGAAPELDVSSAVQTSAALTMSTAATEGEPAATAEEMLDLEESVGERDARIDVLEDQVAFLRHSHNSGSGPAELDLERAASAASIAQTHITSKQNEEALELWRAGYTLGGGQNLSAFEHTILPCESGSQPNPDVAVGRTDDWGRAQINRPVWKDRFESLTGSEFESGIVDPTLNGFMAAHVEHEQGLSAWTCWRNR